MVNIIAFMAFLLATQRAVEMPVYRAEDFHYYDENRQVHPLPMLPKILVSFDDKERFKKFTRHMLEISEIEPYEENTVIVHCWFENYVLGLLNRFHLAGFECSPIVMFDNLESTPGKWILFEPKPSVSKPSLYAKISQVSTKFTIRPANKRVFRLRPDARLTKNILVLANLLASDSFWFKWARVDFEPLYDPIVASLSVITPAVTDLGEERKLRITVDIYDPRVKLRTDLLPQIGHGNFMPIPISNNLWIDSDSVEIKEIHKGLKTTYVIDYPFKVLGLGDFFFHRFNLFYELDGELKSIRVNEVDFEISSVIEGTDISALQLTKDDLVLNHSLVLPHVQDVSETRYLALAFLGLGILGLGLLFWLFYEKLKLANQQLVRKYKARLERRMKWHQVLNISCDPTGSLDWRQTYASVYRRLITLIGVENINPDLNEELNKLYQKDVEPNILALYKGVKLAYNNHA